MKAAKWRELSEDEVAQKVRELSEEIFNLRFQLTMGVAKNPARIGIARRDLARAYTIIRERGGVPAAMATAVAPPTAPAPRRVRKPRPARTRAASGTKTRRAAKPKAKKKAKG